MPRRAQRTSHNIHPVSQDHFELQTDFCVAAAGHRPGARGRAGAGSVPVQCSSMLPQEAGLAAGLRAVQRSTQDQRQLSQGDLVVMI